MKKNLNTNSNLTLNSNLTPTDLNQMGVSVTAGRNRNVRSAVMNSLLTLGLTVGLLAGLAGAAKAGNLGYGSTIPRFDAKGVSCQIGQTVVTLASAMDCDQAGGKIERKSGPARGGRFD